MIKVCPLGVVVRVLYVHVFINLFSECVEALVCTTLVRPTQYPARLIINTISSARMEELNQTLNLLNLPPNTGFYYG
jgi:hypothetical protein